jgi:predicted Zn finger-like uncharacterized protein
MHARCPSCQTVYPANAATPGRDNGSVYCECCGRAFDPLASPPGELTQPPADHRAAKADDATAPAAEGRPAGIAEPATRATGDRNWRLVLIVLIALTGMNLAWTFRAPAPDQPPLTNDLAGLDPVEDPSATLLGEPDFIRLVYRSLQAHALRADALVLQVTFTSDALQAQPWPLMELTLLDSTGGIVAQRRFSPAEFLGRELREGELLPPGVLVPVRLEIADPGIQTSGFELRFF